MSNRGHNENAVRLSALAGDAQIALDRVARGEADAIEGWLAYGAALNEGRSLFPGDKEFGRWLAESVQSQLAIGADEQAAAIWAAANADQFEQARAAGKARTVRGIHAKWKEIEAEREAAAKVEADALARKAAAEQAAQEAEQKATEEAAAKEAVEQAGTPEEREQAEAKVTEATKAKVEAEQKAEEQAQAAEAPAAEPDPHAKIRREFRALTPEGQEDDWIGLREENKELRARVQKQTSMIADLKMQMKDLSDGSDIGAKLSARVREAQAAKLARDEALTAAKRMEYRLKKAEAERDQAVASLQKQEIPLC